MMRRTAAVAKRGVRSPEGIRSHNAVLLSGALIFGLLWALLLTTPAAAEPISLAAPDSSPPAFFPSPLQNLLSVPDLGTGWRPQSTDEALVAAAALGNDPDLERRKPFRKRSMDLFRAERLVAVGRAEMLVRVRLRPSRRETMSVELRF